MSARSGVAVSPRRNRGRKCAMTRAVGVGGRVVELVDDDVVERVGRELRQVAVERLDAREHHLAVGLLLVADEEGQVGPTGGSAGRRPALWRRISSRWATNSTRVNSGPRRVERGEPGLAQSGRHDHQPSGVTIDSRCGQRIERLGLDSPRFDDRLVGSLRTDHDRLGLRSRRVRSARRRPSFVVLREPRARERNCPRIVPQCVELLYECICPVDLEVPLHPVAMPEWLRLLLPTNATAAPVDDDVKMYAFG